MASANLGCYLSGSANCFTFQPANELNGDNISLTDQVQWDGSGQPQNFACNTSLSTNQSIARDRIWYTDDQITRVGTNGFLNVYLVMVNHPAKSPVPNRLNKSLPVGCNNPFTIASLAIVTSSDCGNTWKKVAVLDLNDPTFLNGTGTVPEYDSMGNSNQKGYALDRPEIYVDPYYQASPNQAVFLTAAVRMGPLAGNSFVVKSLDGGQTWQTPVFLPGSNPGASGNPTVITTTPNERVYAFRCEGTEPRLYWSDDYGATFPSGNSLTVKYQDNTLSNPLNCGTASSSNLGSNIGPGSPSIGIARWGDPTLNNVIVTYSAVNSNNDQVQPVMTITTKAGDPNPQATANILIQGASGHSIIQGTLVPADHFEFTPEGNVDPLYDAAILYWMDVASPAQGGQATTFYKAVRLGNTWEDAKPLSLQNSVQYSWSWNVNPTNPFIGDYNRGSFIFAKLPSDSAPTLHFFTTWEESAKGSTPNVLIHSNMVNWNEPAP
jgi:hypothetical protein